MSDTPPRRGMTLEEMQPPYEDTAKCPKTLTKTRHVDGVLYVAGRAPVDQQTEYDIMFITSSVEEEEAAQAATSMFGMRIPQPAEYLKGATGIVKDVALRAGVDMDRCYYTACCKWLLPRLQRSKPAKKIMKWGMPILEDEIARVKPKIIVCLGKHVFDMISPQKISFDDAHGCWFWSEEYEAHLYVMYAPMLLVGKPEYYETFRIDFKEVARRKEILDNGGSITGRPFKHQVLRNIIDLQDWLDHIETLIEEDKWPGLRDEHGNPLLAVDCEWHGRTHIDGKLRTIQFAWSETDAVVIEFRDEKTEWSFDMSYDSLSEAPIMPPIQLAGYDPGVPEGDRNSVSLMVTFGTDPCVICGKDKCEHLGANRSGDWFEPGAAKAALTKYIGQKVTPVLKHKIKDDLIATCLDKPRYAAIGKRLSNTMDRIKARYIGHHFSADSPWMSHVLGMEVFGRCELDTEFAQQTVDESSELGLERGIAMKYTNLGRYDQELTMWKRENKDLCDGGYGFIPSAILHPYGAADVITPYRAYPLIKRQLEAQRLWEYYRDIFNPFVTDVFTEFTLTGLPMDITTMDDLRDLFTFTKDRLDKRLKKRIATEATQKLKSKIMMEFGVLAAREIFPAVDTRDADGLREQIKKALLTAGKLADVTKWNKMIAHWEVAPAFNIRSSDQMARWLFDFEGLVPIKTTNQKAKGLPSMSWEKVLELPAERQALYKPAVDKQTLAILSDQLPAIDELLNLNAVGNLSKAFLKEPTTYIDEETGEEVTEEHGLHAWLASDGRVHGQMSATETGRPRSWAPNTLNWPSYVNKRVALSVAACIREVFEEGDLPENLMKWVDTPAEDLPSIRSCVKAPPGHVFVESDFQTAEMVALAVISGDEDLMRILFDPDPEWALLKPDNPYKAKSVRVKFAEPIEGFAITQNPKFIMHVWKEGKCLGPVTDDMLRRDENGNVKYAKYDIHWSLVEMVYGKGREMMKEKSDRAAGKVLNFCCDGKSPVLTRSINDTDSVGFTPLEEVSTLQQVWDGEGWVHHEGVIKQGYRGVISYDGVRATPEHVVYAEGIGPIPLVDAALSGIRLYRSAPDQRRAETADDLRRWDTQRPNITDRVCFLREIFETLDDESAEGGIEAALRLLGVEEIPGHRSGKDAGVSLRGDGSALSQGYSRVIAELSRTRNRGADDAGGVHTMGAEEVAQQGVCEPGLRPKRKRRTLRAVELASVDAVGESDEHAPIKQLAGEAGVGYVAPPQVGPVLLEDSVEQAASWDDGARNSEGSEDQRAPVRSRGETKLRVGEGQEMAAGASGGRFLPPLRGGSLAQREITGDGVEEEAEEVDARYRRASARYAGEASSPDLRAEVSEQVTVSRGHGDYDSGEAQAAEAVEAQIRFVGKMRVYDIVNAGPRHRFMCGGVLVSNSSAYGASANSLDRKIESDTGVKPEEGTGERGLEAIAARQPRATEFLEEMANVPKEKGMYRAASGRIRHCLTHGAGSGVGWRMRNSIDSALGREMRNFGMQESVGATSARACIWLQKAYRRFGLKARAMTCLYDSVVTLAPLEERFLVARLHQICMSEINTWAYNDARGKRMLQYSIDNEFNYRWSTRPNEDEQKQLDARTWNPASYKLDFLEKHPQLLALAGLPAK